MNGDRVAVKLRHGTEVDTNALAESGSEYGDEAGIIVVDSFLLKAEPFIGGFYKTDESNTKIGCRIARPLITGGSLIQEMPGTVIGFREVTTTSWFLILDDDGDLIEMDKEDLEQGEEAFRFYETPFQREVREKLGKIPIGINEAERFDFDEYFHEKFPEGKVNVMCLSETFGGVVHIQDRLATVTGCLSHIRKKHEENKVDVILIFASRQAVGGTGDDGHLVAALVVSLFFCSVLYNMLEKRADRTCQPMIHDDGTVEFHQRFVMGKYSCFVACRLSSRCSCN